MSILIMYRTMMDMKRITLKEIEFSALSLFSWGVTFLFCLDFSRIKMNVEVSHGIHFHADDIRSLQENRVCFQKREKRQRGRDRFSGLSEVRFCCVWVQPPGGNSCIVAAL